MSYKKIFSGILSHFLENDSMTLKELDEISNKALGKQLKATKEQKRTERYIEIQANKIFRQHSLVSQYLKQKEETNE